MGIYSKLHNENTEWNTGNIWRDGTWEFSKTDKNAISQIQEAHGVWKKSYTNPFLYDIMTLKH